MKPWQQVELIGRESIDTDNSVIGFTIHHYGGFFPAFFWGKVCEDHLDFPWVRRRDLNREYIFFMTDCPENVVTILSPDWVQCDDDNVRLSRRWSDCCSLDVVTSKTGWRCLLVKVWLMISRKAENWNNKRYFITVRRRIFKGTYPTLLLVYLVAIFSVSIESANVQFVAYLNEAKVDEISK